MRGIGIVLLAGMTIAACGQAVLPPMPMTEPGAESAVGGKPMVYDVVSVKVNKAGDGRMSWRMTPDGMMMSGVPITNLLVSAYGLFGSPEEEITGLPKWVEGTRFDIEAKVAPEDVAHYKSLGRADRERMLQVLLAERFQLKATPVVNERPVYGLVVAKGGPKLVESKILMGDDGKPVRGDQTMTGSGRIEAKEGTMSALAGMLTDGAGKTVVDKTGLTGKYDYKLTWTPDEVADAGADNGKVPAPPLFTAIQEELGLKLEPQRGPVKGLMVERLELPTAN